MIAHLKLLLDKLRRMLFGAKSEKLVRQVEQLEFQLEELEAVRSEDRAAALYTLIGSAKLNGIDPQRYLRHVLSKIADHPINRIAELLP